MQLNVGFTQQEGPGLSPQQTLTSWMHSMRMMREMSSLSIISRPKDFFGLHVFVPFFPSTINVYKIECDSFT